MLSLGSTVFSQTFLFLTIPDFSIDCTYPLCGQRFAHVVEAVRIKDGPEQIKGRGASDGQRKQQRGLEREEEERADGDEDGAPGEKAEHETDTEANPFVHYTCTSLAHFIALLCRPVAQSIPSTTAVVVVDSLSALLNEAFPKAPDGRNLKSSKGKRRGLVWRRPLLPPDFLAISLTPSIGGVLYSLLSD